MPTIEQTLRKAIAARKESRYATAIGAGVTYRTLARWLDEKADIRLSSVEALAKYLALELRPKR